LGVTVTFSYSGWQAGYPELANVSEQQATNYFNLATLFQRNDGGGPVNDTTIQTNMLNLLVSHIAVLSGWLPNAQGGVFDASAARVVGHIDSATEGSVTVTPSFDTGNAKSAMQAWAVQTVYGATWWASASTYRTFRYIGGRTPYNPAPWIFG
jgi:hypothetical protein